MDRRKLSHLELPIDKWHMVEDRLAYRIIKKEENRNFKKIYSFDLDNTLILSNSFFKPAQHEKDYIFYSRNVVSFLKRKYEEGYKIIIFSNQKGVSTGKISLTNIINRVEDVLNKLEVPVECYLAFKNDQFRKPRIGMFNFMKTHNNNNEMIEEVIYVGDLANRIYNQNFKQKFIDHLKYIYTDNNVKINISEIQRKLKKDYRDTDLKFALNLNAQFFTPEEIFLNIHHDIPTKFPFEPKNLDKVQITQTKLREQLKASVIEQQMDTDEDKLKTGKKEEEQKVDKIEDKETEATKKNLKITRRVIILIGAPGCGKTSFSNNYFHDFKKISLQSCKTKKKVLDDLKNSLSSFQNVIIDGENRTASERKLYIDEIKKLQKDTRIEIQVEAVYFNYSKDLVFHLNTFKLLTDELNTTGDVPTIAIHSFYKYVQTPSLQEGLDKITTLHDTDFIPQNFLNEEQKRLFFMYLN